jgi:hypothetical protein
VTPLARSRRPRTFRADESRATLRNRAQTVDRTKFRHPGMTCNMWWDRRSAGRAGELGEVAHPEQRVVAVPVAQVVAVLCDEGLDPCFVAPVADGGVPGRDEVYLAWSVADAVPVAQDRPVRLGACVPREIAGPGVAVDQAAPRRRDRRRSESIGAGRILAPLLDRPARRAIGSSGLAAQALPPAGLGALSLGGVLGLAPVCKPPELECARSAKSAGDGLLQEVRGCTAAGERCGQDCSDTVGVVMPTGDSPPASMTSTHRSRAVIMYRRHSGVKGPARIHRRPGSGLNS